MRFSHLRPRNFITDLGNAAAAAAPNRRWDDDIVVSHLDEAELPAPSVIRCAKIATIAAQGAERIGVLAQSDRGKVTAHLARILAGAGEARARRKQSICFFSTASLTHTAIVGSFFPSASSMPAPPSTGRSSPIPARKYGRASSDIILQASGRLSLVTRFGQARAREGQRAHRVYAQGSWLCYSSTCSCSHRVMRRWGAVVH